MNYLGKDVELKVVGTRPIRPDGADKVTGRASFGADFAVAGMIHGSVVRSPVLRGCLPPIVTEARMCGVGGIERVGVAETRLGSPPPAALSSNIHRTAAIPIEQYSTVDFADQSRIAQAIGNISELGTSVAEHSLS